MGVSPTMKEAESMVFLVSNPAITSTKSLITSFSVTWMIPDLAETTVVCSMLMLKLSKILIIKILITGEQALKTE